MTTAMNSFSSLASNAALLAGADAILKATLILGAAAIASIVLRRASAAVRHLVWTLALIAALAIPALSLALPRWELPIFSVPGGQLTVQGPALDNEKPAITAPQRRAVANVQSGSGNTHIATSAAGTPAARSR